MIVCNPINFFKLTLMIQSIFSFVSVFKHLFLIILWTILQYIVEELKAWLWKPLTFGEQMPFKIPEMPSCFSDSNEYILVAFVYWNTFTSKYRIVKGAQEEQRDGDVLQSVRAAALHYVILKASNALYLSNYVFNKASKWVYALNIFPNNSFRVEFFVLLVYQPNSLLINHARVYAQYAIIQTKKVRFQVYYSLVGVIMAPHRGCCTQGTLVFSLGNILKGSVW